MMESILEKLWKSDFKGLILQKPEDTILYLMTGFDGSWCILYGGKAPFFVPK